MPICLLIHVFLLLVCILIDLFNLFLLLAYFPFYYFFVLVPREFILTTALVAKTTRGCGVRVAQRGTTKPLQGGGIEESRGIVWRLWTSREPYTHTLPVHSFCTVHSTCTRLFTRQWCTTFCLPPLVVPLSLPLDAEAGRGGVGWGQVFLGGLGL